MREAENDAVYYVHNDHLGTPKVLTDGSQKVVWRGDALAFGETEVEGRVDFGFRFPGQAEDGVSGYFYNYFRDYDASLGRYLQSDPIGLRGGVNTFGYVGGNPLFFIDPYGLELAGFTGGFSVGIPILKNVNVVFAISATYAVDSELNTTVLYTPEVGFGSKGGNLFLRGVLGLNPSHTVDDLVGSGASLSIDVHDVSTSLTFPGSEPKDAFPIIEVGGNIIGDSGASITYGEGMSPATFVERIKRGFRIAKDFFEFCKGSG